MLLLGFAAGGFFDGVLLHQILQWHHLLSALDTPARGLAFQVTFDGYFHLAMYLLAGVALTMLWRSRAALSRFGASGAFGLALIGFGVWHLVDAVLSHWLLGIHRIRMDADNLLLWDLAWLAAFGVAPAALGLWLQRGPPTGRARPAAATLAALAVAGGAWASRPPSDQPLTAVVFAESVPATTAFAAAAGAGEAVLWLDPEGRVFVVSGAKPGSSLALYRRGAQLVTGGALPAGCLSWSAPG